MFFCWLTASLVISNASDDTFMAFSAVDLSFSISSSFLKKTNEEKIMLIIESVIRWVPIMVLGFLIRTVSVIRSTQCSTSKIPTPNGNRLSTILTTQRIFSPLWLSRTFDRSAGRVRRSSISPWPAPWPLRFEYSPSPFSTCWSCLRSFSRCSWLSFPLAKSFLPLSPSSCSSGPLDLGFLWFDLAEIPTCHSSERCLCTTVLKHVLIIILEIFGVPRAIKNKFFISNSPIASPPPPHSPLVASLVFVSNSFTYPCTSFSFCSNSSSLITVGLLLMSFRTFSNFLRFSRCIATASWTKL